MNRLLLLGFLAPAVAAAAPALVVTVNNPGALARPAETIPVPWVQVYRALPGARLNHLAVRDAHHVELAYQVTNLRPEYPDPQHVGLGYGDLLFQHDFAAGETQATFTVDLTEAITPPFASKVFCRFVPERLDDFAWENDKVAHRTYGPALMAPDLVHSGKEVAVESGIDVWCKRVAYPVINRWYTDGNYHHDQGEGMDMYEVGASRGCGGTAVWDGKKYYPSRNFATWKVIANGPVRAIFELHYGAWPVNGQLVAEIKRYTVDAGHYFDQVDSTFRWSGGEQGPPLTIAVGLDKISAEKGQDPQRTESRREADHALVYWQVEKTNGALGTAIMLAPDTPTEFADTPLDGMLLTPVHSGFPLRFYAGAAWSGRGEITTREGWESYVAAWAARLRQPVSVAVSTRG